MKKKSGGQTCNRNKYLYITCELVSDKNVISAYHSILSDMTKNEPKKGVEYCLWSSKPTYVHPVRKKGSRQNGGWYLNRIPPVPLCVIRDTRLVKHLGLAPGPRGIARVKFVEVDDHGRPTDTLLGAKRQRRRRVRSDA